MSKLKYLIALLLLLLAGQAGANQFHNFVLSTGVIPVIFGFVLFCGVLILLIHEMTECKSAGDRGVLAAFILLISTLSTGTIITEVTANYHIVALSGPTVGGGGASYPDIIFYWDCDSDTAVTTGDNSAVRSGGAVIDVALKKIGTGSLDCPNAQDYASFDWSAAVLPLDSGRIGFYVYFNTRVTNTQLFYAVADANNGIYGKLSSAVTDELAYSYESNNTGSVYASTAANLADTTWYFIEFAWDRATDYRRMFIDGNPHDSSAADLGTGWTANPATVVFGNNSANLPDFHMDQIIISNDYTRDLNALKDLTSF